MALPKRTVVVTGASQGIGRSIATTLATTGWHVVAVSRNESALQATVADIVRAGGSAEVCTADVSDENAVSALAEGLTSRGVVPDAVVNNSGIGGPSRPVWEVDLLEWQETFAVNVVGAFLVSRAFVPAMIDRGSGAIVNIGSDTGKNPLLHRAPYAASKAAMIGFTKTFAADAGPHGVRVNMVSPGAVSGARLDWVVESLASASGESTESVRADMSNQAALRRFTEPDEVAQAVDFLLSDKASGITGIDLTVAAGLVMN